mgnify:FL=1
MLLLPLSMKRHSRLIAVCLLSLSLQVVEASEQGFLGIAIYVDGEGLVLNQSVRSITVTRVVPNSPASKAGLSFDDQLLEIDGKRVRGARISELRPLLEKRTGQSVSLVVKKKSGSTATYSVVFGERPPQ